MESDGHIAGQIRRHNAVYGRALEGKEDKQRPPTASKLHFPTQADIDAAVRKETKRCVACLQRFCDDCDVDDCSHCPVPDVRDAMRSPKDERNESEEDDPDGN